MKLKKFAIILTLIFALALSSLTASCMKAHGHSAYDYYFDLED